jgi:3-oxoacyl-[acyl-carrier protein] reductase
VDLGLDGKVCVVTGASRGIGRDVARRSCAEGASVLLVARSADDLEEAAAEAREAGGEAATLPLDVTEPEAGERMLSAATDAFGQLDVLVNNAGTAKWRRLEDVPDADWQAAWEVNVMAPLRAMRAVIPGMRERGWGRIVNVSSTSGKRPSAMMPEYSVAKAAELSLSRLFADRYASDGVLVNAVCPGPTKSELWMDEGGLLDQSQAAAGEPTRESALEAAGTKRPIGRLAEVGEIAGAIVFLCSQHASYVSGAAW